MKFTLKDYQTEAVADVMKNLQKARKRWHEDSDSHAFSLTATTGAGKTVMAAAVFEALFYGEDDLDFDPDPTATVIWFSDDPSLNEQTRFRLLEASDKLNYGNLVVVENTFSFEKFEPGKIYFLNTQKLSRNSLLVRGYDPDAEESKSGQGDLLTQARPDFRSHTIWEVLKNTIDDSQLTLYLVLDEAHRGMGSTNSDMSKKSTIVKRLINGAGSVPAIPIVWGISATVERFNQAMKVAQGRALLPNVEVDSKRVQDSGLLKDTIVLDIPSDTGQFDTVLLRRGADKLRESTDAWKTYCDAEGLKAIVPLMVLQVPNKPNLDDLGKALDTLFEHSPDLKSKNIAHVFGERANLKLGNHTVFYIEPQRVQDEQDIKVLLAKDAISTGWDCPRAEVMVSFRPAKDKTHITQLLGRMVRTPLARRIPGNERLNAVDCLLPFYDKDNVKAVAEALMHGGGSESEPAVDGRRVLINPFNFEPNVSVKDDVWTSFTNLPSQLLPQSFAKPVKRLTSLAHELAQDSILTDAGKKAHAEMHKVLDAASIRFKEEISSARKEVLTVGGLSLRANLGNKKMSFDQFVEEADFAVIEDAYRRAARLLSPDLSRTYAEHLADLNNEAYNREEALLEAHTDIAALGLVRQVVEYLDKEADTLTLKWLNDYRVEVKNLSDERQDVYLHIREMSKEPQDIEILKPRTWILPTMVLEVDGSETPLPTVSNHLMSDDKGLIPVELNQWELKVLETEMGRSGFECWYRNPDRASQDSLAVAYIEAEDYKLLRPDFLFFARKSDGSVVIDIVDPHGIHLSDALPKLRGLAEYAEKHKNIYRRIESIADPSNKGQFRLLDLTNKKVREAIFVATDAKGLFTSNLAEDYQTV
ncbi:DEAD/DEAH box helicase family protein [Pseudidiomarina terrestris]|uniref:DEAD/DEAH box helicase family protein n=1 Tax=Pseudidiomarina terrestris TaxID=2820060 RepID=UPI0026561080|nr:DEAD/DEAH box helicase family protein [Pseudidiomarina sp. 1ASP75-5]MDN7136383.1 DEAD/DEAH box helicase family protein [Pseudidiomarina sp. 1ASP75-5]